MPVNQHVVRVAGGWGIHCEGEQTFTSIHRSRQAALEAAGRIARRLRGAVLVHGPDGRVQQRYQN